MPHADGGTVAADVSHNLGKVLAHLRRVDLLIIDELGYLPMDGRRASLFFQLVAARYTRGSLMITSNVAFEGWGKALRRRCDRLRDPRSPPPPQRNERDRHNPELGQATRRLARRFVVLPRHALYGREVVVLSRRRESNVTVRCIVALPENLAFRYRLPERWLESMPPDMPAPSDPQAVHLPLAVLDTLTQRLLGFQRAESAYGRADLASSDASSDLDAVTAAISAASDRAVGVHAAPGQLRSDE